MNITQHEKSMYLTESWAESSDMPIELTATKVIV